MPQHITVIEAQRREQSIIICDAYTRGYSVEEIADFLNTSMHVIVRALRAAEIY